jgi:hypothetical protein
VDVRKLKLQLQLQRKDSAPALQIQRSSSSSSAPDPSSRSTDAAENKKLARRKKVFFNPQTFFNSSHHQRLSAQRTPGQVHDTTSVPYGYCQREGCDLACNQRHCTSGEFQENFIALQYQSIPPLQSGKCLKQDVSV